MLLALEGVVKNAEEGLEDSNRFEGFQGTCQSRKNNYILKVFNRNLFREKAPT